jgi:hypothetical protein
MNWSLIAAGVTAGLGLVIAKQWFDRRGKGQEREAIYRRRPAPPAASDTPAAETESPLEDTPDADARVSEAGDAESVAEPDAETAAKRDTEVSPQPDTAVSSEPDPGASPQGTSDEERVEEALASGDLSVMETVLQETDDSIQRNLLLNRLVAGHYRLRSEPEHREAFYRVAHAQIDEASAILNAFDVTGRPRPDRIEAFKSIAIALDEDERYDEAVAICEKALSLGLEDGTKTGFKGRIARLKKSRDSE